MLEPKRLYRRSRPDCKLTIPFYRRRQLAADSGEKAGRREVKRARLACNSSLEATITDGNDERDYRSERENGE